LSYLGALGDALLKLKVLRWRELWIVVESEDECIL